MNPRHPRRVASSFASLVLAVGIAAGLTIGLASATTPRAYAAAPAGTLGYRTQIDGVDPERIGVRFLPETGARVREGQLVSTLGADLGAVREIVASVPGARIERRFPRSEADLDRDRRIAAARTKQEVPDLNLFALVVLPHEADIAAGKARLGGILARLNAAPGVAEAWAQPKPELASIRQIPIATAAGLSSVPQLMRPSRPIPAKAPRARGMAPAGSQTDTPDSRTDTPDFSPLQGYLYDSPTGVWADSVWGFPGGMGQGVKMIDFEFGWLFTHEDLGAPWYYGGAPAEADHGTAVCGEIVGRHNGYGINGIAPETLFGAINTDDLASRIIEACGVLAPGDLYLVEIQIMGPQNWMPMEWVPDIFAAVQTSSALGIIPIEAAGNGTVDLDDPLYGGVFDRHVRDSGAIICGAGTPQGLDAEWFSNYGSRVSLQGWGSSVVTACCGDLQGGDPTIRYTAGFNGTSSASPIVTGSVASIQGQALALFGTPLTAQLADELLSVTGTPWNGTKEIGERPNLVAARQRLLAGFADVLVTVRDADTQEPMPGMFVTIVESGRLQKTGPEGQALMQLLAGPLTFHVSGNFWYEEADIPFTVVAGPPQEVVLEVHRAPFGALAGTVRDQRGAAIDSARVVVLSTPLDTVWTGTNGQYTLGDIPQDTGYTSVASQVPAHGAAAKSFDLAGGQTFAWDPVLVDAQTFEANNGGYTPTADWEWGTPTWPNNYKPIPFSGTKVWGTVLGGYYHDLTTSVLTSPTFNLSGTTTLTLSFHHWYWIESDDGGQVQVWDAAHNQWVVVYPVEGYPDDNIIILNYGPGYNGTKNWWSPAIFRLDQFAGQSSFQFRFYFKSNYQAHQLGWYLDDVALDTGQGQTVSVDPSRFTSSGAGIVASGPNPSSTESRIALLLPKPAETRCELYNVSGRLVRTIPAGTLPAGRHEIVWDGRDDDGRTVASGMYLYRIMAGNAVLKGRITRIR